MTVQQGKKWSAVKGKKIKTRGSFNSSHAHTKTIYHYEETVFRSFKKIFHCAVTWIAYIPQISWHLMFYCVFKSTKIITVNPRWIIAVSTARFISCSLTIRYSNMRTSRLIWKGSAGSVIDTNIRNSCIFFVYVFCYTLQLSKLS